jgi:hypothetical protein
MPPKSDLRKALKPLDNSNNNAKPVLPQETAPAGDKNPYYRPSRVGKVNVTGYYDPAVKIQLRQIAMSISHRITIQDCLTMALNDFFAKHGHPEIAK